MDAVTPAAQLPALKECIAWLVGRLLLPPQLLVLLRWTVEPLTDTITGRKRKLVEYSRLSAP